ncbi:MAG: hypothetical protein ACR2K2_04950 [Mycobacteriales bacterium]
MLDDRAHQKADPVNPELVFWELNQRLSERVPAAEFAKLLGFEGIKVNRPEDVGPAWDRALTATGPVVLEFVTDPRIPPLPPHVRVSQRKTTATALVHGYEDAVGISTKGFKGKLAEVTEHLPGAGR